MISEEKCRHSTLRSRMDYEDTLLSWLKKTNMVTKNRTYRLRSAVHVKKQNKMQKNGLSQREFYTSEQEKRNDM